MMRSTQRGSSPNNPPVTTKSAASQRVPRRRDIAHQLKALVQLVPDATVVVDGGGRIRLVNLQTEELFGYSSDELLGQPVELLVPERLWAVHQQHRAMYASAPYVRPMGASLPLSGRRRDGSEFSIEASLGPLDKGDESLVIVSIRDITERKRLEQMLAERVAQLEAVMEAVPEVLTVYNAAGRIVLSNTAHHAWLARFYPQTSPGETVRERFAQLGGVFDAKGGELEEAEWPQTRVLRGEVLTGTNAVELSVRTPQNELATFSVSGAPLYNADSKIIGAVTVSHDITEQKRLERERTEQAEQLDRIFEGIADGVGVYDTHAQLVRLNAAARRILGLDAVPAEYAERPLSDRVGLFQARDEQDRSVALEDWPLVRVLSEQATGADMREVRLRTLDGRDVELSIGVAPLRDGEGCLTGAVGIFRDQTEQKRLAREREEARAHELALEDTARHMDEFLATASHDLRTPLTVVKSRLQIGLRRLTRLQDSAATSPNVVLDTELEAVHESLLAANRSADQLTHLVALLFDVSRARSGTLELQLARCDLAGLVREQVATRQMVALDRKIELVLPDSSVVWVLADADRLSQVLGNYLSNALKYSPADQPVTVRLEVAENRAVVSVADHGPGILLEEQSRIWDLFHRVPGIEVQSWSGETSGSLGLGLHICKQLIELHPGGRVGVESTVGTGSTFWFQLPLVLEQEFHHQNRT